MVRFKYAFCEWYTPIRGPLSLKVAAEAGYDGIQIDDNGGRSNNFGLCDKRIQQAYLEAKVQTGIEIQMFNMLSLCMDGTLMKPKGSTEQVAAVESFRKGLEACVALGIPNIFYPSAVKALIVNDYDMQNTIISLREVGAMAKDMGIQLLFESFIDANRTIQIYEACNGCFKLLYDTLNPFRYGFGNPSRELPIYGAEFLHTIHVKDSAYNLIDDARLAMGGVRFLKQQNY
jgi:sugar phosphate isomerase/epimerase